MSLRSERAENFRKTGVYLVLGHEFCAGRSIFEVAEEAAAGGVRTMQLREKHMEKRELYPLALRFREFCSSHGVFMMMNDHVDIALACGADGVHLGQSDLPLEPARKIAPDLVLGRSTHSRAEALEAVEQGADYINLGPIFATKTKETHMDPLGPEIIREMAPMLKIPFSVMGGVKAANIPELVRAGAKIVAMVTELTQAPDVRRRAIELERLLHDR